MHHSILRAPMQAGSIDTNHVMMTDPGNKYYNDQADPPAPTPTPKRFLLNNFGTALPRWPPNALESSVTTPRTGKQHTFTSSCSRHRFKEMAKVFHMDVEEDAVEPARPSSLARSYQTLGIEIFNLDRDVESKSRRSKPQKISKSGHPPFPDTSPGTTAYDSSQARGVLAGSGRAVLGSTRSRGASMPANTGRTAMELDLGVFAVTKTRMDSTRTSLDAPNRTLIKSSLLPSLAMPGKTAGNVAWSVKMAHNSTPRGGHQSVF